MSSDESSPADAIPGSELRASVFLELVDAKEPLTPTEIGRGVGESRQSVMYHLDSLVDSGLVVKDEGAYYPQPMFVDPGFEKAITETVSELVEDAEGMVYIDEEVPQGRQSQVLLNCIETALGMWLFDDEDGA